MIVATHISPGDKKAGAVVRAYSYAWRGFNEATPDILACFYCGFSKTAHKNGRCLTRAGFFERTACLATVWYYRTVYR